MPHAIQFDTVAELYDDYVTTEFDIPFFLNEVKEVRGKVLELMCGTGRVSLPLLRADVALTCVDYSHAMLTILRRKLEEHQLRCNVHEMDVTCLDLPDRFDRIMLPFHSFSEILEPRKQYEALRRIRDHLTPRGRFLCTLQNPKTRTGSIDGSLKVVGEFPTRSGSLIVKSLMTYDDTTRIASGTQFYEVYDNRKTLKQALDLEVHFYLHTREAFEELLRSTGFTVEALYGDYSYTPFDEETSQFMIWKLQRHETRS